ncbi:hypothetical protein [Selenomonas ruminis]|uniref:Uncharacterized protein n=1 Tax=Selenomonas ruminis TaxID=2593411 RepID=A0A5D6W946_9FIRM|nr:hypothetical protein [Selenomonas sp. mPRGC5]TYZ25011.1 hypothetical protein FZ040_03000 [Selenomonas sp. mPRGC5]
MKKGLMAGLTMGTIMITSVCSAMTMQAPQKIGKISLPPMGWYEVKGATTHEGVPFKNVRYLMSYPSLRTGNGSKIFDKGVACFGNGEDCIYVHYDARDGRASYLPNRNNSFVSKIGGKDVNNTIDITVTCATNINCIKTDTDEKMYLLVNEDAGDVTGITYTLIGKRSDGSYVKYFDTYDIIGRYYANKREVRMQNIKVEGDEIICNYCVTRYGYVGQNYQKTYEGYGKLCFKWDDEAKWFGVENNTL